MSQNIRELKGQITSLEIEIANEESILSNYNHHLGIMKVYEQKKNQFLNKYTLLEQEVFYLSQSIFFRLFPMFFKDRKRRIRDLKQEMLELKKQYSIPTINEKIEDTITQLEQYKEQLLEIDKQKIELEQCITSLIEVLALEDHQLDELKILDEKVKKLNRDIEQCEEAIAYKELVQKTLSKYRGKLAMTETASRYDLYDLPMSGIVKFIRITKSNKIMDNAYDLIAELNERLKPFNFRLRCNIGGLSSKTDYILDNAYTDYNSLAKINSIKKEFNETVKELIKIESSIKSKKDELEQTCSELKEKRSYKLNKLVA